MGPRPSLTAAFVLLGVCLAAPSWSATSIGAPARLSTLADSLQDTPQAERERLLRNAEQALARLGRTGGYYNDPRVRIGMPPALREAEKLLRRLGGKKETEAFILAMNQTAETLMAQAAPLVMAAARETGGSTAAFRDRHEADLLKALIPMARALTEGKLIDRAYQRVVKQSARFGYLRGEAPKLEDYLSRQALEGLFTAMSEARQAIETGGPAARTADRPLVTDSGVAGA